MRILKVGFGNRDEAYIEDRFLDGVNIIYSKENNKGKTLVMQAILYAIGNDSIFPSGFDTTNYYFFVEILLNNKVYKFLRKKNTIVIIGENLYRVCDSIAEFKHFVNDNILSNNKLTFAVFCTIAPQNYSKMYGL